MSKLDRSPGTNARVEALQAYSRQWHPSRRAWALSLLLGNERKRLLHRKALRGNRPGASALPEWLFDDCPRPVWADSCRKPSPCCCPSWRCRSRADRAAGWGRVDGERLPAIAALRFTPRLEAVTSTCAGSAAGQAFLFKQACSPVGLRGGCGPQGLVDTGPARLAGLEEQRSPSGSWVPGAPAPRLPRPARPALTEGGGGCGRVGPIPSFWPAPSIAAQLEGLGSSPLAGGSGKVDGIRGQLIAGRHQAFSGSRGEELW